MKKLVMPFIGLLSVATAFGIVAAFASVNASVARNGDLRVTFRATGIDPTMSSVAFNATADATANWACVNNGGNSPNAANKRTTATESVDGSVQLKSMNGAIAGSITIDAPQANNFECPKGQTETLTKVTYSNVRISSDTLNISKTLSGKFQKAVANPR